MGPGSHSRGIGRGCFDAEYIGRRGGIDAHIFVLTGGFTSCKACLGYCRKSSVNGCMKHGESDIETANWDIVVGDAKDLCSY